MELGQCICSARMCLTAMRYVFSLSCSMVPSTSHKLPTLEEIRTSTQAILQCHPCHWQLLVTESILKCNRNMVSIAGTGMGKTLTFWMLILFMPKDSVQIVVTPLNNLGKQKIVSLEKLSIQAVFICAETATSDNFHVSFPVFRLRFFSRNFRPSKIMNTELLLSAQSS